MGKNTSDKKRVRDQQTPQQIIDELNVAKATYKTTPDQGINLALLHVYAKFRPYLLEEALTAVHEFLRQATSLWSQHYISSRSYDKAVGLLDQQAEATSQAYNKVLNLCYRQAEAFLAAHDLKRPHLPVGTIEAANESFIKWRMEQYDPARGAIDAFEAQRNRFRLRYHHPHKRELSAEQLMPLPRPLSNPIQAAIELKHIFLAMYVKPSEQAARLRISTVEYDHTVGTVAKK